MADGVRLNIISTFDPKGIKDTKAGMQEVTQSANIAGASTVAAGQQTAQGANTARMSLQKGAAAAAALSAALGQSSGGVGASARGASAILGAMAGGPIAVLIAGITSLGGIWIWAKQKQKAATDEMLEQVSKIQKTRFEKLVEEIKTVNDEIRAGTQYIQAYRNSMARLESAQSNTVLGRIEGERSTALSGASGKDERDAINLKYDAQVAKQKSEAAKIQATMDKQSAELKLSSSREIVAQEKDNLQALRDEYDSSSQKPAIAKQIKETQIALKKAEADEKSATIDLLTATETLTAAREAAQVSESEYNTQIEELAELQEKRRYNNQQIEQNESAMVDLTAELNAAIAGRARMQKKEDQRDREVSKGFQGFVADRQSKRDFKKEDQKAFEKEARWAAQAEKKLERNQNVWGKDDPRRQRLTDFRDYEQLRNRGGQKEFGKPEEFGENIRILNDQLKKLDQINTNLTKNLTVN